MTQRGTVRARPAVEESGNIARMPGGDDRKGDIVVRRRVLRPIAAAMLLLWLALAVKVAFWPDDEFTIARGDWGYGALMGLLLAGLYMYVASRVVVGESHVRVHNPLRVAAVPVGHIREVRTGTNLELLTDYGHFVAWGVEAGALAIGAGVLATQTNLRDAILERAASGRGREEAPARYRWAWPPALVLVCLPVIVACFYVASR